MDGKIDTIRYEKVNFETVTLTQPANGKDGSGTLPAEIEKATNIWLDGTATPSNCAVRIKTYEWDTVTGGETQLEDGYPTKGTPTGNDLLWGKQTGVKFQKNHSYKIKAAFTLGADNVVKVYAVNVSGF
ncbi:MAG: hypothetical protein K2X87_24935 [Gemmataceae bacterium]|nr:hypothetical protein [Gemmataceae bacterium]